MFRHILIATNGSPLSAIAMRDGVELARVCKARVTLVHCSPAGARPDIEATAQERMQPGCDLAAAAGVPARRLRVVAEQPWEGILETADRERCDLIVLASRGHRPIAGLLLGSQTLKLLTQSDRAIMVCAARERTFAVRHILAPTDGSVSSVEAVRTATDLAAIAAARVTLMTCTAPVLEHAAAEQRMRYEDLAAATAEQRLAPGDRYARERGVAAAREHAYSTHPHRAILDFADRSSSDLIVMASHGRSGTAAVVLGSETLKVLTRARVPVLVVR